MRQVAVIASPDPGHALPAIGLGAALVRQGVRVRLASGGEHEVTARAHGLSFVPLPSLPPDPRDGDIGHRLWGRAADIAPHLVDMWRADPPSVVVSDTLVPAGGLAAQRLGVPWIELVPHHLPDPAADLPPVGLGRRPARCALRRADDRRIHRAQLASVRIGAAQALAAARSVGLDAYVPPAVRLVATLPALERPRTHWPADAHVVGPLAVDPQLPPLEPPDGDDPLVVVTDSTAPAIDRSLGEVAVAALAGTRTRLVVTSASLAPRRDERVVVGVGPHAPLLRQADLAVGPGGGGFVSKVLAAGAPIVVVPLAGDQREAAARLRDARVGRVLPPSRLTPRMLRWAALRHLADRRARRAASSLARQSASLGADLAAAIVTQVARGHRPVARGPDDHLRRTRTGSPSL